LNDHLIRRFEEELSGRYHLLFSEDVSKEHILGHGSLTLVKTLAVFGHGGPDSPEVYNRRKNPLSVIFDHSIPTQGFRVVLIMACYSALHHVSAGSGVIGFFGKLAAPRLDRLATDFPDGSHRDAVLRAYEAVFLTPIVLAAEGQDLATILQTVRKEMFNAAEELAELAAIFSNSQFDSHAAAIRRNLKSLRP
jgi:hypothetical protein